MRPVSGFERPAIQWVFVSLGFVLVVVAAGEAVAIRRARARIEQARTAELNAKLDRQQLEIELARERRARENVSIEVGRLRQMQGEAARIPPALTLSPLATRGATPPAPSVEEPDREQVIELRLVLPRTTAIGRGPYTITLRRWSSGETVWTRGGLTAATGKPPAVAALITGDLLAAGSYGVLLRGAAPPGETAPEVAAYELTVSPKSR